MVLRRLPGRTHATSGRVGKRRPADIDRIGGERVWHRRRSFGRIDSARKSPCPAVGLSRSADRAMAEGGLECAALFASLCPLVRRGACLPCTTQLSEPRDHAPCASTAAPKGTGKLKAI